MGLFERGIPGWRAKKILNPEEKVGSYTDADLTYAATARCPCGAGLATVSGLKYWDCSDILKGAAVPTGEGAVAHCDLFPYSFYDIKSERQPSALGATTRPAAG